MPILKSGTPMGQRNKMITKMITENHLVPTKSDVKKQKKQASDVEKTYADPSIWRR